MIINPKVGDHVKAKSGGPAMTVTFVEQDVYGEPCVVCDWQDDAKTPASGTFTLAELVKA